jgi:D-glycerate 3-kinase
MLNQVISQFIRQHQLPNEYAQIVHDWFIPVVESLLVKQKQQAKPLVIGINGAQGSGKSTLSDLLTTLFTDHYKLSAVNISLDDFYYTYQQRQDLASSVHPLLATRGVPGTHDTELAINTLNQLLKGEGLTRVPRFDKANDDRSSEDNWTLINGSVDIIIFEGWCLGAEPQTTEALLVPVNELESTEDIDGTWRNYINEQLKQCYSELFSLIDSWLMLKAPSFDVVYNWRLEQEHKLRASTQSNSKTMDDEEVAQFIKFYQRITEQLLLTLPNKVDFLFELDPQRKISKFTQK